LREQLTRTLALIDGFREERDHERASADELRQAEAERRGRGRWARLRAAWHRQ
jgi:hypothetical protein